MNEWLTHQPQEKVDQTQHDGAEKCREKTLNAEAGHEGRSQLQHQRVDHEPEHSERKNGERKCDELQKGSDRRIHKADNNRRDQSRAETRNLKAADDVRDDHQTHRAQYPIDQQPQHGTSSHRS